MPRPHEKESGISTGSNIRVCEGIPDSSCLILTQFLFSVFRPMSLFSHAAANSAPTLLVITSIGSLMRPGIISWINSMPALVEIQMIMIVLNESWLKLIFVSIANGINRNRFKNLSVRPEIWMNPKIPSELGSTGVKTIAHKQIR